MSKYIGIIVILLVYCKSFGQDTVYLRTREIIPSKVLEITSELVKFKKYNNLNGPLYIYRRIEILKITYENGMQDEFSEYVYYEPNAAKDGDTTPVFVNKELYLRGRSDATIYYKKYVGSQLGAALTTSISGPVIGLLPVVVLIKTPPEVHNLSYPDKNLINNRDYHLGYTTEALTIKKRKVWKGYAMGCIGYIAFIAWLASSSN